MTSVSIDKLHTRNVGHTVAYVHYISKWNANRLRLKVVVYSGIINIQNAFFNSKQKLCFVCVIDGLRRPNRCIHFIKQKGTCIDLFKLFCDRRSLDHLFKTRRNDIMFDDHIVLSTIISDSFKPSLDSGEQFYFGTVLS